MIDCGTVRLRDDAEDVEGENRGGSAVKGEVEGGRSSGRAGYEGRRGTKEGAERGE